MADITGTAADDTLTGSIRRDFLIGLDGDDLIEAGDGRDLLYGGAGADRLFGGRGYDQASYAASAIGVQVSLATGLGAGGDAEGDTLSSISELVGSAQGDILTGSWRRDALIGGDGNDSLFGGGRDDWLDGGAGADLIFGGTGIDRANYQLSPGPVTVALEGGACSGTWAEGDALFDIENLNGSFWGDTLTGSAVDNLIFASAGDDTVYGLAGADGLEGWSGDDRLFGGAGDDRLAGGLGTDWISGGAGNDLFVGELPRGDPDRYFGGAGDDTFQAGSGEIMTGGSGADLFDFQNIGLNLTCVIQDFAVGEDTCRVNLVGFNNETVALEEDAAGNAVLVLHLVDWVPRPTRIVFKDLGLEDLSLADLDILT